MLKKTPKKGEGGEKIRKRKTREKIRVYSMISVSFGFSEVEKSTLHLLGLSVCHTCRNIAYEALCMFLSTPDVLQ